MSIDISGALVRITTIEDEIMTSLSQPTGAVGYFTYAQDTFPYWTNRMSTFSLPALNEDIDYPTYNFILRLVIGHATEDYDGGVEARMHSWIPTVVTYFQARPRLQTDVNNRGLNDLLHAQIVNGTGLRYFPLFGNVAQIGCEFTLQCEFAEEIDQAYS